MNGKKNIYGVEFSACPYDLKSKSCMSTYVGLLESRDAMSSMDIDNDIENKIVSLLETWDSKQNNIKPFSKMQKILESVRKIPPSDKRVKLMNSIIRTLGKPDNLATFLDMLRSSSKNEGSDEQNICKNKLQTVKMHSIYGWSGTTLIVESLDNPNEGTHEVIDGLGEKLGNSPSAWNLTIHIWQPNLTAKGFSVDEPLKKPNVILEPPHSHPFDFLSFVVKGNLHQSLYVQEGCDDKSFNNYQNGYYSDTALVHVDGIWPPHDYSNESKLNTLEHRVLLQAGDSYFMPCDWIHDVEIDASLGRNQPTITLFFSSEYMVMPHAYISKSMFEYHVENPDLKKNAKPISEENWHKKLKSISDYLRDEEGTLDLNEIIQYKEDYAFFHV